MAAHDAVCAIVPDKQDHEVGCCLGGTMLAIAAVKTARAFFGKRLNAGRFAIGPQDPAVH